jgi:hypothetical protein
MRKLVLLGLIVLGAWWVYGRRRGAAEESATIGYADGSSVNLDDSPERESLLQAARAASHNVPSTASL